MDPRENPDYGQEIKDNYMDDFEDLDHPSGLVVTKHFQLFFNRYLDHQEQRIITKSEGFFLHEKDVFIYRRDTDQFEKLKSGYKGLADYLYDVQERNRSIYMEYASEIDNLEDYLYERNIPRYFMDIWFDQKKDMSKIDRYYQRNIVALKELIKKHEENSYFPTKDFLDVHEEATQIQNSVTGQLSKLDSIHNYYSSIKNDKLNNNIYLLTVLSGIFLPLNLIVGFFGMNTENLIFKDDPQGTSYVLYTLIGVIAFTIVGFKIIKIIDNYILRYFLGKYKFYDKLTKKIENFGDVFKLNL